jgi:hypothetical protein
MASITESITVPYFYDDHIKQRQLLPAFEEEDVLSYQKQTLFPHEQTSPTNKRLIKFNMRKAFFVQGVFPKVWHGYPQWCKGCLVGHRHSRHVSVLAPTHMGLCELTAKSSIFLCGLMSL